MNHSLLSQRLRYFYKDRLNRFCLMLLATIVTLSLLSDLIANERPLLVYFKGKTYLPIIYSYPETTFDGDFKTETKYDDPVIVAKINQHGWMILPPIPYRYDSHDFSSSKPQPMAPNKQHLLGTDDQGRDILARLLYGLRTSILFGVSLTASSLVVGVAVGAICGYFGGIVDLIGQRLIEVWSGMPTLYVLIILSSFIQPDFFWLLFVMLLFGWIRFVGVVRAEFLRTRQLAYVQAAQILGVSNTMIIYRHILPNSLVATISLLPWHMISSIMSLTALDFLGFGMPIGSASLGELVSQAKTNLHAPWIALSIFFALFLLLGLLVFLGEGLRDALDPRYRGTLHD
tara:strand:+ start:662 stop:1693 length:1032 start_codon:yes stop_codon:yes gene_type:complete